MKKTYLQRMTVLAAFLITHFSLLISSAQTLNVQVGSVTYQFPAAQTGEMTYGDGTTLTIMGRTFTISEISSMMVDNTEVKDSQVGIVYNGTSASVMVAGNVAQYVTPTISGADVTIDTGNSTDSLLLVLSGSTTDGSLLVNREKKYGILLNGVSIHNADGPAINNQCGKSLFLEVAAGTTNTLSDGTVYAEKSFDQKGTLFSEGQVYILGSGTLQVNSNCKHAIASDDYIVMAGDATLNLTSSTGSGIKVNDGLWINGGTLGISVTADAARGIKSDSVVVITGGNITIKTTGDDVYEAAEDDYSSAACIKCDYPFTMSGGTLTMTSSGDGGKGLNCDGAVTISGGTFSAITSGGNDNSKPKAVKGNGITVSGGSFYAKVSKSWACDNGVDSETPADHITIVGTPSKSSITKKEVNIVF